MNRLPMPRQLGRDVLVEAGHRCAIPTCRQTPVEIAHIVPWEKVMEHTFDNLIALCPTCHTRYDGDEIDRKSMQQYKANLSILNGRYGDLEQRILKAFADHPNENSIKLMGGFDILLMYLLQDGLLENTLPGGIFIDGIPATKVYKLTDKGKNFINKWISAEPLT